MYTADTTKTEELFSCDHKVQIGLGELICNNILGGRGRKGGGRDRGREGGETSSTSV